MRTLLAVFILTALVSTSAIARKVYSKQTGAWTTTTNWIGNSAPVANDTVIIQTGHTMDISSNLYSNSTYMFIIIVGTLDLTNNGKISLSSTGKVIIETGGRILGDGSNDQISIGTGPSEYAGTLGTITGPAYINNGHSPVSGEGTGGCGCYTPGVIPLPIELAHFNARKTEESVALSWTTSMENGFDKFIVERSHDGKTFSEIGFLNGAGKNFEGIITEYFFNDKFPLVGMNYYRLRALDLDGSSETFNIIAVAWEGEKEFSVFPTVLTSSTLKFITNFKAGQGDRVYMMNANGETIEIFQPNTGLHLVDLKDGLSSGIYFLTYHAAGFSRTVKFIIK